MNKQSGLLALSGHSSSRIEDGAHAGDKDCLLALDMSYYRTSQLIMEMAQAMHGFDAMAFSAGIGENSDEMRLGVIKESLSGWASRLMRRERFARRNP